MNARGLTAGAQKSADPQLSLVHPMPVQRWELVKKYNDKPARSKRGVFELARIPFY